MRDKILYTIKPSTLLLFYLCDDKAPMNTYAIWQRKKDIAFWVYRAIATPDRGIQKPNLGQILTYNEDA